MQFKTFFSVFCIIHSVSSIGITHFRFILHVQTVSGDPLELVHAHHVVNTFDTHGAQQLVTAIQLTQKYGALLVLVIVLLQRDDLIILKRNLNSDVAAVGRYIVKVLAKLELELKGLEGGGGLDGPLAPGLGDLGEDGGVGNIPQLIQVSW